MNWNWYGVIQYAVIIVCYLAMFLQLYRWLCYAKGKGRKISPFDRAVMLLFLALICGMAINLYSLLLRMFVSQEAFQDFLKTGFWVVRYIPLLIAGLWFNRLAIFRIKNEADKPMENDL